MNLFILNLTNLPIFVEISKTMVVSKAEIKRIKSLGQKKFRDEMGLFVVEGEKMGAEALDSDFEVLEVYKRDEIGPEAMERMSLLSSPSPVLAVVRQKPQLSKEDMKEAISQGMLALGLDSVRDPGNLGTIIRLADWFGFDAVFASFDTVDLYNPKVVQSTMGAIFRKKLIYCDLADVCDMFSLSGMKVYGTFLDGENIYEKALENKGLVIMGNESVGISDSIAAKVSEKLLIPSFAEGPTAESLNVAIATAVTASEFRRRKF